MQENINTFSKREDEQEENEEEEEGGTLIPSIFRDIFYRCRVWFHAYESYVVGELTAPASSNVCDMELDQSPPMGTSIDLPLSNGLFY